MLKTEPKKPLPWKSDQKAKPEVTHHSSAIPATKYPHTNDKQNCNKKIPIFKKPPLKAQKYSLEKEM